jgi:hypothetical protein
MRRLLFLLLFLSGASPAAAGGDWWLVFEERSRSRQSLVFADASSTERRGDRVSIAFALIATDEPPRGLAGGVLHVELLCGGRQMRLVRPEALPSVVLPPIEDASGGPFQPFGGSEADPVLRFACAGERTDFTHLPGVTDLAAEAERRFAEARPPPPSPAAPSAGELGRR